MTRQILELEARLREVRAERDDALGVVKMKHAATTKSHQLATAAFLFDFRTQSKTLRNQPFYDIEQYLEWLAEASESTACYIQKYATSEVAELAYAEMRLLVANDTACAINRDLTRLRGLNVRSARA